ncbi:MAG: type secretion system protein [Rhodospirillales bacterium]|jgi:type VI secretion system protein ImpA|nr:type secretion system protein [Rhodospirillales bacterium]
MASASLLDFDRLLAPITSDAPAGIDLRADPSSASLYFKMKDARSAARASERGLDASGTVEESGILPAWRTILEASPEIIAGRAKDLEIAAWLTEALVRASGVAGLRDGFRLITGLVEGFWEGLYPLPDEDGLATRIAPITGLNGSESDGTLIQPIRKLAISQGGDLGRFALWQYDQAFDLLKLGDADRVVARIAAGAATMEAIEAAVRQTPPAFYRELVDDLDACIIEYARLTAALAARCGADAPPASNIRNTLEALRDALRHLARDVLACAAPSTPPLSDGTPAVAVEGDSRGAVPSVGIIGTRDEALRTLLMVSQYFRKSEPQSHLSYAIDEVVRRAKLPMPQLILELIPNQEARNLYFLTAGIKPPKDVS